MPSDRSRSQSPARKPKKSSGFKWKEKRPRDADGQADERAGGRLERGYRDRSPVRQRRREDDETSFRRRSRSRDRAEDKQRRPPLSGEDREGEESMQNEMVGGTGLEGPPKEKKNKKKKDKQAKPAAAVPAAPTGPMIVVNINDRLGTKAAIPCLASDSVKAFKAIVAAHIGRKPHEILIKRQGERPMKDILTLEDYGVSNGVQLDLELDTGD